MSNAAINRQKNNEEDRRTLVSSNVEIYSPKNVSNNSPVVVLIGWITGSLKNLRKYAQHYLQKGFIAVAIKVPDSNHYNPNWMRSFANNVLLMLETRKLASKGKPLFFHVFSGNIVLYSQILDLISYGEFPQYLDYISGQIFDSSGSDALSGENALKALTSGSPNNYVLFGITKGVLSIYEGILADVPKINENFQKRLTNSKVTAPALCLYSADDKVMPAAAVEDWAQTMKLKGTLVFTKKWDKSVHVQHFRVHHDEYCLELDNFLQLCINNRLKSNVPTSKL